MVYDRKLCCTIVIAKMKQLPRTINMLNAFRRSLPEEVALSLSNTTSRDLNAYDVKSLQSAGRTLWERLHYPVDKVLESILKAAHPDLPDFTINYLYGGLFSDPDCRAATRIDRISTSLFAIACLRAQQGVGLQLLGHVSGLKNSWEDGSWRPGTHIGPADAIEWLVSDEGCMWMLKTIDGLVEALLDAQTSTDATIKARI
jgi:alkylhydroperoxidase/carboxymuconolactone decarboxylase family protein YurZ